VSERNRLVVRRFGRARPAVNARAPPRAEPANGAGARAPRSRASSITPLPASPRSPPLRREGGLVRPSERRAGGRSARGSSKSGRPRRGTEGSPASGARGEKRADGGGGARRAAPRASIAAARAAKETGNGARRPSSPVRSSLAAARPGVRGCAPGRGTHRSLGDEPGGARGGALAFASPCGRAQRRSGRSEGRFTASPVLRRVEPGVGTRSPRRRVAPRRARARGGARGGEPLRTAARWANAGARPREMPVPRSPAREGTSPGGPMRRAREAWNMPFGDRFFLPPLPPGVYTALPFSAVFTCRGLRSG
jgi:hypothetical protein